MADGFSENAEFFTMTYEAPRPVAHNRSFEADRAAALAQGRINRASD